MTPEDFIGKKVRLMKRFTCELNVFKKGDILRVLRIAPGGGGIILRDRFRPDIRLALGNGELEYCQIIHDSGRCYNCNMNVISKDGRTCPFCGRILWELAAQHAKHPQRDEA